MRESVAESVANQKAFLEKKLEIVEKILAESPEGNLQVHSNNNSNTYYVRDKDPETGKFRLSYISRESKLFPLYIRKYCARKIRPYLISAIKDLCTRPLEFSTAQIQEQYSLFEKCFGEYAPRCFETRESYIRRWQNESYNRNPYPIEREKAYITERGETVRSKNECICADILYKKGIPYRYDAEFRMKNGQVMYTDFIVLNPKNWHLYYIEIFGMMSDSEYMEKSMKRISDYADNGILLGDNLLAFFESKQSAFNMKAFRKTIEKLFC